MRELLQHAIISLGALTIAVWAGPARGFHFESYSLCGEPLLYTAVLDSSTDGYDIVSEPIQFNVMQQVENIGHCTYAFCEAYIEAGDRHFNVYGRSEASITDGPNAVASALVDDDCDNHDIFSVIVRRDLGDPPTCTLFFDGSGLQRYCYCGGGCAAIDLYVNSIKVMDGYCFLQGADCIWDSTGTVEVADGDTVRYNNNDNCPSAGVLFGTECIHPGNEVSLTVELIDSCMSSVAERDDLNPQSVCLHQNSPNPFTAETAISFDLPTPMPVHVAVYTPEGRLVSVLTNEVMQAGRNTIHWRGTDDRGRKMTPGIYFCHLVAGGLSETGKMLLLE
jgi:hypothetical protein